ncbi:g4159 [Coccomyxa elongata]
MSWSQPKQSAGLDANACAMFSSPAPRPQGHIDGLPSPHTLCRSFGTPPPASSLFGHPGCLEQLPSLATCGPQPSGFTPRDGEPADPLSLADDEFTSFAFNLAWGHSDLEQPQPSPGSRAWHRLGTDSPCELRAPRSPFASSMSSALPNMSMAQAALNSSSKVLIDSVPYPPFGSAGASIVSTQEGEMRRASTLTSAGSGHSHKRPSGTDILEEACKRARSTPDLSHSSFNSDTSEDFSAASGAGYIGRRSSGSSMRQIPSEMTPSPTVMPTPGEHRLDAGSAATTPVIEGLPPREPRRQQRVPAMHARPSPSSTLRPFSIVKGTDGAMTLAQLNSRIKAISTSDGPQAMSPTAPARPASSGQSEGSPMLLTPQGTPGEPTSSPSARSVTPAIRLSANSSVAGSGITIKQMLRKAWQR